MAPFQLVHCHNLLRASVVPLRPSPSSLRQQTRLASTYNTATTIPASQWAQVLEKTGGRK